MNFLKSNMIPSWHLGRVPAKRIRAFSSQRFAFSKNSNSGFSIIEIILAVSLFSFIATGTLSSTLYGEHAHAKAGDRRRATLIADQTFEFLRSIRDSDSGFSALANGVYGFEKDNGGAWTLVPDVPDITDIFERTVTISSVDDNTKQVNATVCWPADNCVNSLSFDTYFSNWHGNFGTPGGIKIAVSGEGHAYVITTNNTLEVYDVSTPASPVKVGEVSLTGAGNDLPTALFYSNEKVYIASSDISAQLQIVDVSTPASPALLGTLAISVDGDSNAVGDGVWAGSTGYVFLIAHDSAGTTSQFFMIDATDPANASLLLAGDTYTTGDEQTPGGIDVGIISSVPTMCTTEGGSPNEGYVLHCYSFNFATPSYTQTIADADVSLAPSRTMTIQDGLYAMTPGGKVCAGTCTSPYTVSENDIYDIVYVTRSGRLYGYAAVPGDIDSGLKEVDGNDNPPVIITERDTGGTFSSVVFDSSTTPNYIFGTNKTGSTLGLVSFAPTPVGINISPSTGIVAGTVKGAGAVHCDPTTYPSPDDTSCPTTYTLENVIGDSIDYTVSTASTWITLSKTSGTISGGGSDTVDISVDAADVNAENSGDGLSEGVHIGTVHFMYTTSEGSADISRTVTLTVDPALGINVEAE